MLAATALLTGCELPGHTASSRAADTFAFTDVTEEAGLGGYRHVTGAQGGFLMPETMGGGGGFLDYNGDGLLDILLVRGGTWGADEGAEPSALALFMNDGAGRFIDQTREAGLDGVIAYAFGPTVADVDNDGDEDIFLTTLHENMLFRNDGGVFSEVGRDAGVAGPSEWSTAAVFLDADLDGWLDLFVGNYVRWTPESDIACSLADGLRSYCTPQIYEGLPGRFFRNNGDGTFREQTEAAGFGSRVPGKTLAATTLDYNNDRYPDIVVANDTERDLLYRNNGDGTFEEVGTVTGVAFDRFGKARAGMGVDAGYVDSTGYPTIFVANFSREMIGMYRYSGGGRFVDRAAPAGVGQPSMNALSFALFVFDPDLNGYLDLFVANGHISPDVEQVDGSITYRQPAHLYRNRGDGTFERFRPSVGGGVWDTPLVARGAAYGDYDGDGDPDVLVMENGGPAHLWRNDAEARDYLRIRLQGRTSNRSAIGARVDVFVAGRQQTQFVRSGAGYISSSEKPLTFGLGSASTADSVLVHWPSGSVDALRAVASNQELTIVEGIGSVDGNVTEAQPGQ